MKERTDMVRNAEAMEKCRMILPLLGDHLSQKERKAMIQKIAKEHGLSSRTIERYLKSYQEGGIEALRPKECTGEHKRILNEKLVKRAIELRVELPTRSVKDIITILETEGWAETGRITRATLQRYLQKEGYSTRQLKRYIPSDEGRGAVRRYQKRSRMKLVQADIKYGPYLYKNGKRGKRVYYIGWTDDYSRFVLGGKFYMEQNEENVIDSLKMVVKQYGLMQEIIVDNGSQYIAKHLKAFCGNLNITLKHAKPRNAKCKGKQERLNGDIEHFRQECNLHKCKTVDEVNAYFYTWLEAKHQDAPHSAFDMKKTPREVFEEDVSHPLCFVPDELVEAACYVEEERTVKNCCVSVDGIKYEVPNTNLDWQRVSVRWMCRRSSEVIIMKEGYDTCIARPLVIGENVDFKRRAPLRLSAVQKKQGCAETGSSLLKAQRKLFEEANPDSERFASLSFDSKEEEKKEDVNVLKFATFVKED